MKWYTIFVIAQVHGVLADVCTEENMYSHQRQCNRYQCDVAPIEENSFVEEATRNCQSITRLDLSHNNLNFIGDLKDCQKLQELVISFNNLAELKENSFKHLDNLMYVDLSGNNFTILPTNLFKNNKNLKVVQIGRMQIANLNQIVNQDFSVTFLQGSNIVTRAIKRESTKYNKMPIRIFDKLNLNANEEEKRSNTYISTHKGMLIGVLVLTVILTTVLLITIFLLLLVRRQVQRRNNNSEIFVGLT